MEESICVEQHSQAGAVFMAAENMAAENMAAENMAAENMASKICCLLSGDAASARGRRWQVRQGC